MIPNIEFILGSLFALLVVGFLIVDLGFLNRSAHRISFKSALRQSLFWIAAAVGFAVLIWWFMSPDLAYQFLSAYATEKILSVDNLFVILLIFGYFQLEEKYHHKVLFWGILGAILMRALFIGAGSILISHFHWILYVFGAILIWSGISLIKKKDGSHIDFDRNIFIRLARRWLPFGIEPHHGRFTHRENGKIVFTTLFLVVLAVEATDLIFAVDSIPAVFTISQDPFIVYTSNIFAIMGLRALFFLLEDVIHRFHHLSKALAFILIFIGLKMLGGLVGFHLDSLISLAVIIGALGIAMTVSWMSEPRKKMTV